MRDRTGEDDRRGRSRLSHCVCASECVCVCVCVRERERERELLVHECENDNRKANRKLRRGNYNYMSPVESRQLFDFYNSTLPSKDLYWSLTSNHPAPYSIKTYTTSRHRC